MKATLQCAALCIGRGVAAKAAGCIGTLQQRASCTRRRAWVLLLLVLVRSHHSVKVVLIEAHLNSIQLCPPPLTRTRPQSEGFITYFSEVAPPHRPVRWEFGSGNFTFDVRVGWGGWGAGVRVCV